MALFALMRSSMSERNPIPLILTAIGSVVGTVAVLSYYGYLHIAKPEDALLLADYTMLKTVPGEDYRVSFAASIASGAVHRRRAGAVRYRAEGADRRPGGQQKAGGALHGTTGPGGPAALSGGCAEASDAAT